jgi:trigger factor
MAEDEVQDQLNEENEGAETAESEEEKEPSLEEKLKEVIDVQVEDVGALRKKMTVTVPRETIDERLDEQYTELRTEAIVPGFRRGRAPRRLLEKRFGSEVGETLSQQLVSSSYIVAVEKTDLKVIGEPLLCIKEGETETYLDVQEAIPKIDLPAEGDLSFACEVEVSPEFDLPELEGIPIEKPVVEITDREVDEQIDRLLQMRGTFETQPGGQIEEDDLVIADLRMTSGDEVLKEQDAVRLAARGQVVDGVPLEKLGETLKGAKAGDIRTISGQIADDYVKAEFRGKQADFEFKIREVQRLNMPKLDEEFITSIGFETEKDLREFVQSDLESRVDQDIQRNMAVQVRQYLLDNASFDLPERLNERQTSRVAAQRMLSLLRQGVPPAEADKLLDEVKTSAKEDAARELKMFFIMEKLAEDIDVEVTEGELNAQIAAIAYNQNARFDRVRDQLVKEGGLQSLHVQIRDEKIIAQLLEKANVTEAKAEEKPKKKEAQSKQASAKKSADKKKDDKAEEKPEAAKKTPKRKPPAKKKEDDLADET